jgi:preprotein translocase subunit SecA
MAGRGTDIALSEDVSRNGGLHVVLCQANASRRIDRQFTGRAARRGEPGSCEALLSLESPPMLTFLPAWITRRTRCAVEVRPRWLGIALARLPLWLEGRRRYRLRRQLQMQEHTTE